jgi:hypothetical protein
MRDQHIKVFFESLESQAAYKVAQKEKIKKQNADSAAKAKVGDIYYASWGYDQTNVEFYKILSIEGKSATFAEVSHVSVSDSTVVPGKSIIGEPIKKKLGTYININSSVSLSAWDGSPKYETPWGMGH